MSARRVAMVTGAARGIGAATVRRLARDGYRVTALDWCLGQRGPTPYPQGTRAQLDRLAAGHADQVTTVVADVRDRSALEAVVQETVSRWGRLDAVVAAAAVMAGGTPLWETAPAELDLLWDIDVRGVWNTAAVAIPVMIHSEDPAGCRFVAVSSAAGDHGLHRLAAYTAGKHAVVGLVRGLAADLVGTGVTAVVVSPGSTRTAMLDATARVYGMADPEEFANVQLLRRLLEPDEVAATIAFCCSQEGAALNGSVVHADGGFGG